MARRRRGVYTAHDNQYAALTSTIIIQGALAIFSTLVLDRVLLCLAFSDPRRQVGVPQFVGSEFNAIAERRFKPLIRVQVFQSYYQLVYIPEMTGSEM